MASTTNYSWSTPDNTAYVKDGASSIRTLGSSVDTTLFTALGGAYPGLRLVKKQTIGSAVSSVTVTNAFSATYENYQIIVSGGASTVDNAAFTLKIGAATSAYYYVLEYNGYATSPGTLKGNNAGGWVYTGSAHASGLYMNLDLQAPYLSKITSFSSSYFDLTNRGSNGGYLNTTNSYTDFTLSTGTGTLTGGTIYVYGYGAS